MKSGDKVDVNIGLVLSRKKATVKSNINKIYKTITIKSINEFGEIDEDLIEEFNSSSDIDSNYITEEGDILIRLTNPYTAVYINLDYSGLVISSNFAKIKLKTNEIIPEFLAIYLNSSYCKKQILKNAVGSSLASITVKDIKEIILKEVMLKKYTKELQEKTILINDLHIKETKLMKKLIKKQNDINNMIIKELLK